MGQREVELVQELSVRLVMVRKLSVLVLKPVLLVSKRLALALVLKMQLKKRHLLV